MPRTILQRLSSVVIKHPSDSQEVDWQTIMQITRTVEIASRYVPGATCLTQALAASLMIRSSGQDVELKIGVEKTGSSALSAHAWLEKNGRIVLGELPNQGRLTALKAYRI